MRYWFLRLLPDLCNQNRLCNSLLSKNYSNCSRFREPRNSHGVECQVLEGKKHQKSVVEILATVVLEKNCLGTELRVPAELFLVLLGLRSGRLSWFLWDLFLHHGLVDKKEQQKGIVNLNCHCNS